MKSASQIRVWNFELPPYPRDGLSSLEMSEFCQINRLLKWEAGRLSHLNQLDLFDNFKSLRLFQSRLRNVLRKKMGLLYDRSLPLDVQDFGTIREEGFFIRKLTYQSQPGVSVSALLYVPDGKGPFPAVMHLHGHNGTGKYGDDIQALSLALVKCGYVVLTVDSFGTYERASSCYQKEYHGGFQGAQVLNIGETLLGLQVTDNMRGIDFLCSLPCVQKERIGVTGASGGGNQTMWLSAMDERIAAAAPVVSVGSFESYVYGINCMCELLPDGLTITEESGVLALIAPRPLRICNAFYDSNHDFGVSQMLKTYHAIEKVYRNLGYPDRISFYVADRTHGMCDRQREAVLGFFAEFLKNEGNGNPVPEPEYEVMPEKKLHLFPSPAARPDSVISLPLYLHKKGVILCQKYLSTKIIDKKKSAARLKELLRLPVLPPAKLHRYAAEQGTGRYAADAGHHLIPFLTIPGSADGRFRILLHQEGKSKITQEQINEAKKDGSTLVLPDLFCCGETCQENPSVGVHHQFARQLLWIGHSILGEWVADILVLAKLLKRDFNAERIAVTGFLGAGPAAIFANVFSGEISSVDAVDCPASFLFDCQSHPFVPHDIFSTGSPASFYTAALSIPGFLQWGDISLAAALGKGTVRFLSPRTMAGTPLTKTEERTFLNEITDVRQKLY